MTLKYKYHVNTKKRFAAGSTMPIIFMQKKQFAKKHTLKKI